MAGEKEIVVRELWIFAIQAEVKDEAGAGGLIFLFQRRDEGFVLAQQFFVGGDDFHVRHDDVGGVKSSVRHQTCDARTVAADLADLGVEIDFDVELSH
jgi:hypothetical protein